MQAAAGNLKKVSLELGGKSPNVVYADADLHAAIRGSANGIFFNTVGTPPEISLVWRTTVPC